MAEECCCHGCCTGKTEEENTTNNRFSKNPEDTISVFHITGLDCADCAAKLEHKIASLDGVTKAVLNFGAAKLTVQHQLTEQSIIKAVAESGYQASGENAGSQPVKPDRRLVSVLLSGGLILAGMAAAYFAGMNAVGFYVLAIIIGGWQTAKSAYYSVKSLTFDMNFLMSIAVIGAGAIGEWHEGAVVVFLFSLGNLLQSYTLDKTRRSIQALVELTPRQALVRREEEEMLLYVDDVCVGDIMIVKPGERIALDGIVAKGLSSVNQAAVTGESLPVEKVEGDVVYAGTLNENGSLEISVTKLAAESTIALIREMVEEAQAQKAPAQQLVDKFARYYTPAVLLLAVGIALIPWLLLGQPFSEWFYMALVLLVISCPCALVLSTPVSIVSAIGSASRQGVLIKGGAYLEQIGAVKVAAFDKTGTLTQGTMTVTNILPKDGITEPELLSAAAALESLSEHPLAKAVVRQAEGLALKTVDSFTALPGRGVQGDIEGQTFLAGNRRLFTEADYDLSECEELLAELEGQGKTVMLLGSRLKIYGLIAAADTLRENSLAALKELRQTGIEKIVMLTGDNRKAAEAIGQKLELDTAYSELLPADKVAVVKDLAKAHGGIVMVGDGINDAPALASADIGVAMGAAGSDAALEAADIALMVNDLGKLGYVVKLSRKTLGVIKQNIVFSVLVKAVFILLTLAGVSNLWLAVFADTGAAVLVTLNGMRLAARDL